MNNDLRMIAGYWYNRPENLQSCAKQLLDFILLLQSHNPDIFGKWFERASSKKKALERQVFFEHKPIQNLLSKKANNNDFPDTCFSTSLWNGKSNIEDVVLLSVSLGSREKSIFPNNCIIEIGSSEYYQKFYQIEVHRKELLNLVNKIFQPKDIKINGLKI